MSDGSTYRTKYSKRLFENRKGGSSVRVVPSAGKRKRMLGKRLNDRNNLKMGTFLGLV